MQINHLSRFSVAEPPAVTRVLFSPEDVAARKYIKELMDQAGLKVRCIRHHATHVNPVSRHSAIILHTQNLLEDHDSAVPTFADLAFVVHNILA